MASDLYSKKYNIRLFHCPKCAMTSLRHSLSLEWIEIENIPTNVTNVFVYRDVVDRFVSAYFQIRKTYNRNSIKHFKKHFIRDISEELLLKIITKPDLYLQEILDNGFWDYHQMSQSHYANNVHERKMENIDLFLSFKELSVFFTKLGIDDSKIINKNLHPQKKEIYSFFKTKSKEINYLYKQDIKFYDEIKEKINGISWHNLSSDKLFE